MSGTASRIPLFLLLWLCGGFSLGTSLLAGPVRWITTASRKAGMAQGTENASIGAVILLYVVATAGLAFVMMRLVISSRRLEIRYGLPLLCAVCALGAAWLWLSPGVMVGAGEEADAGSHFTFGPYPDEAKLHELKRRGYTAVISLLHPAVIPFEPRLLADEQKAASRVQIPILHLPMLPWVSENRDALDRLDALARKRTGRYYVHCYLGRDRVNLARRIVDEAGAEATGFEGTSLSLAEKDHLERGPIQQIAEGIFLTPYPTDEEFLAFFLNGGVGSLVSLLDPTDPDDLPWIEKERAICERYGLPFLNLPIRRSPYAPDSALAAARRVREMTPPLAVHAFLSPASGRAPAAEAFLQAFRSGLLPLPPSGFRERLVSGVVDVVAPNIAYGPRPTASEFTGALRTQGIAHFIRVGNPDDPDAREDAANASRGGVVLTLAAGEDPGVIARIATGGPWYLYGPEAKGVRESAARLYGPAIPEAAPLNSATMSTSAVPPGKTTPASESSRWIPSVASVILVAPPLLLASILAGAFAGWLRVTRSVRAPFTRKVFHFIIFTLAGVLHLTAGLPAVMMLGGLVSAVVLYAVIRGDGFPLYEAMARPTDAPRRTLFILVPLATTAVGGLLSNLLFPAFAWVGYLVGGWGDAAGEPVGTAWGRHRYRVPSLAGIPATRSLEGSTAVFLVGSLAALLGFLAAGVPPTRAVGAALTCGLAGALTEAVSTHGVDNLTIQLAASGTALLLLA